MTAPRGQPAPAGPAGPLARPRREYLLGLALGAACHTGDRTCFDALILDTVTGSAGNATMTG